MFYETCEVGECKTKHCCGKAYLADYSLCSMCYITVKKYTEFIKSSYIHFIKSKSPEELETIVLVWDIIKRGE